MPDINPAISLFDGNPEQPPAFAGPADTHSRIREKDCTVVRAYQMHALGIKKTARFPVKLRGHVGTPVKIRVHPTLVADCEPDRRPAFMEDVKTDASSGIGKFGA